MKRLSLIFLILLTVLPALAQAPIRRQFFTTNDNPIVDVVAGSNATVVATTPAPNIRRFTVSSTAMGGGSGQTNDAIVAPLTNIVVVTNSSGGTTLYSIGGLTDTNIVTAIAQAQTNGLATTNFVLGSQVWTNFGITTSLSKEPPVKTNSATPGPSFFFAEGSAFIGSNVCQDITFPGVTANTRYWPYAVSYTRSNDPIILEALYSVISDQNYGEFATVDTYARGGSNTSYALKAVSSTLHDGRTASVSMLANPNGEATSYGNSSGIFYGTNGITLFSVDQNGSVVSRGIYYGNGAGLTNLPVGSQVWTNDAGTISPTTNAPVVVSKTVTTTNGFTTVTGTNAIYSLWSSGTDYERYLFEPEDTRLTLRADTAGAGDDNLSIRIMPVGNGAFYLDNAGSTAGNARGNYAVDLQIGRGAAAAVASGNRSVAIGYNNYVSGEYAMAIGLGNNIPGAYSIAIGDDNYSDTSSATLIGYGARTRAQNQIVFSARSFSAAGDAQQSMLVSKVVSSGNASTNTMMFDAAGNKYPLILAPNTSCFFYIQITARSTDAGTGDEESAAYEIKGLIERDNSAAATRLVGSPIVTTIAEDDTAWDVWVTADTTNGALQINVAGNNETAVRWVATVHLTEVGG